MGAIGFGTGFALGRAAARPPDFDFTGGVLPAGATLARASVGTCIDAGGLLVTRAADQPRFDHDPASGRRRGLLVEPAATNLLAASAAFDDAGWVRDGSDGSVPAVTPDAASAPDGSAAADRIAFDRTGGYARIEAVSAVTVAGATHQFSVWLRAATAGRSISMRLNSFDGATLVLTDRWTRAVLPAPGTGVGVECQLLLWSAIPDSPAAATVDAWGAQFETGDRPTSYIATAGAVASRAADVLTLDWRAHGVADGPLAVRCVVDGGAGVALALTVAGGVTVLPAIGALPLRAISRA